jgi:hypothetical protein
MPITALQGMIASGVMVHATGMFDQFPDFAKMACERSTGFEIESNSDGRSSVACGGVRSAYAKGVKASENNEAMAPRVNQLECRGAPR